MIEITLPLPPSLNHAYLTTRQGKRIMTAECRKYKDDVSILLSRRKFQPLARVYNIHYKFYLPDNRKRDIPDNYSKVLRDCLKGVVVEDDCWQCIQVETFGPHAIDKDNPRVEIFILPD